MNDTTKSNATMNLSGLDLKALQEEIAEEIRAGRDLLESDGLLTPLIKSALEAT